MNGKSIVFSDTMERKFIALAMTEGMFHVPESNRLLHDRLRSQGVTRDEISQIHANIFLNPNIKLQIVYEHKFEPIIENIHVEMQRDYNDEKEFKDAILLCSLVLARNPSLTIEFIRDSLNESAEIEQKVVDAFGAIPTRQNDGNLLTLQQSIRYMVSRDAPPQATQEQKSIFEEYERASEKVRPVMSAYKELQNLYRRATFGDSIVIDPLMKNSFTDFLDEKNIEEEKIERIDLFYLFIKELRALPVGRSIKETIELANTREGDALRKRVGDLHESILGGEVNGLENIKKKIRDEIHEYRRLTNNLISPNGLSDITDLTLSATSLIPVVGTATGAAGLAKTAANIAQKRSDYKKIQDRIWVEYRGTNY